MTGLVDAISAGKAFELLARIRGWSPKGRSIVLVSVEGSRADSLENRVLEVQDVRGGDLVVGTQQNAGDLLRPRHRGWTAGSLMALSIAVTVHELSEDGPGEAIAAAVVRLDRVS
jgi:hypothetical protein